MSITSALGRTRTLSVLGKSMHGLRRRHAWRACALVGAFMRQLTYGTQMSSRGVRLSDVTFRIWQSCQLSCSNHPCEHAEVERKETLLQSC